jgi:hypothetical protein
MKARLKTIILSALGAISAFSAVTYSSCSPDKCKAIVCAYGGVCKEGTCICPTGYEGYQCETIIRDKYRGVWRVFEKGSRSRTAAYEVTVDYGANMTDMVIKNFYNKLATPVNVRVKGDTMFIPQQTVEGYEIKGTGYLTESKHYGENGELRVFYSIKLPDGRVNDFGVNDLGDVSLWHK